MSFRTFEGNRSGKIRVYFSLKEGFCRPLIVSSNDKIISAHCIGYEYTKASQFHANSKLVAPDNLARW